MMEKIKAAVLSAPRKLEIREFERPRIASDAMLLKVVMCGVCGSDVHIYRGTVPITEPFVLGHEVLGEIAEIGDKAAEMEVWGRSVSLGDKVVVYPYTGCGKCIYCRLVMKPYLCTHFRHPGKAITPLVGGYAQYVYVPSGSSVYKLPEDMPSEIGVLVDPLSSALAPFELAFQVGRPQDWMSMGPGKVVVIQGSGPIGALGSMVARLCGAWRTIVVGAPEERLRLCKDFGADFTVNIQEITDPSERVDRIKALTPGKEGADVVIEAAGVPSAVPEGIEMVRGDGIYVEMGHWTDRGTVQINPHVWCRKNIHIYGCYGYDAREYETALRILDKYRKEFPLEKIVTHRFPLDRAEEAIKTAERAECMKAVIVP